ncbi:hypothetical protein [Acaryochloris sp. IP29b_bin.148]|uniref:hypothetical protein n=1 Tax=Acaryochloris sp. IP29b_bin.148 TaxID=2969218 RepID=UPI00261AF622|nr:hypothetical protein [Acaryochloris sp. IP29b_bin.148]
MRYQSYFNLKLFHNYYREKICPDFTLESTLACQHLLQGHRCLLKSSINGVQILVPLETPQQPLIPLDRSLTLTFLLRLNNPAFISFTQLDPRFQMGHSLYVFSNETLTASDSSEMASVVIQRSDLTKPAVTQSPIEARCAATLATLSPHQRQTVFGLVEIHNNGSLTADFSQSSEFKVTLAAKQQIWAYYLVVNKGTSAQTFSIQDKNKDKSAAISFETAIIASGDRIVTALQNRFPNSQSILLKSTNPVTCQQIGRPQLQLLKQDDAKPWISHLPNPPNQHGTQVINLLRDL